MLGMIPFGLLGGKTINTYTAPDKAFFSSTKKLIFFLFLNENICCGYSLEAPHQGASNEYPQCKFLWRYKKNLPDST